MGAWAKTLREAVGDGPTTRAWGLVCAALAHMDDLAERTLATEYTARHMVAAPSAWGAVAWWAPEAVALLTAVGIRPLWARAPAGTFQMGSPDHELHRRGDEVLHPVTLTRPFLITRHPVTQGVYEDVTGANPSRFAWGATHPVESVSWLDAVEFCNAMSIRAGFDPVYERAGDRVVWKQGDGVRLPTDAEWEYACRAGTTAATYAGDPAYEGSQATLLDEIAWYGANSQVDRHDGWASNPGEFWPLAEEDVDYFGTHPVGTKRPNAWGLYDPLGNVCEWVWDTYRADLGRAAPVDPQEDNGAVRVYRGGSFLLDAGGIRAAQRSVAAVADTQFYLGFRCARTLGV